MHKIRLKRGDRVQIIAGKDKGKEGKILIVDRDKNRVIVEGANMIKKHMKQRGEGQQGGIIDKEASIHVSNVALLAGGKKTRIGYKFEDGKKIRIARKTGETVN